MEYAQHMLQELLLRIAIRCIMYAWVLVLHLWLVKIAGWLCVLVLVW